MFLKKIKELFAKNQNSDKNPSDLAKQLDKILTENEMELEKAKEQVLNLEKQEQLEIKKLQQKTLSKKEEKFSLQKIQQLRKQATTIEERIAIYGKNIDLNLRLIGKIQSMQAMKLKGVEEDQIDEIFSEFELNLDTYMDTLKAAEQEETTIIEPIEPQEEILANLKQEILTEKESTQLSKSEEELKKEIEELELEQ